MGAKIKENVTIPIVCLSINFLILILINLTKIGKIVPLNYILFAIFTGAMSYAMGFIGLYFFKFVFLALALVIILTTSLYLMTLICDADSTLIGGALCVIVSAVLGGGLSYLYLRSQ